MDRRLSPEAAEIVKMTAPAFKTFGLEIARSMYDRLLASAEARALFGEDILQEKREHANNLAAALYSVASNIDNITHADALLEALVQGHIRDGIKPGHYPHLADALLSAIRDVLGEGASDRVLDGWREGFWYLAELLIEREAQLYRKTSRAA